MYTNSEKNSIAQVEKQYNLFPYPRIPLLAKIQRKNTFLMNYVANIYGAFGSSHFAVEVPKILVVGCGTFEPCIVALANPNAEIIAIDLSRKALQRLRWHALRHGVYKRIECIQGDFLEVLPNFEMKFDFIIATGVLHHLPFPGLGLSVLEQSLAPKGILRAMLYSSQGRDKIYQIRELAKSLNITTAKDLKTVIQLLPSDHPLKIHFYLYGDSNTETGIVDGFLHAIDHSFTALECKNILNQSELVARKFLHPVGSRPMDCDQGKNLSDWEKLFVLDCLRELETNFHFIAIRESDLSFVTMNEDANLGIFEWNPILEKQLGAMYSRLLRKTIQFTPAMQSFQGKKTKEVYALAGKEQTQVWFDGLLAMQRKNISQC